MDYLTFVRRCDDRWARLEQRLDLAEQRGLGALDFEGLEALVEDHRAAASDFATARASFPGTGAEVRLRSLVLRCQNLVGAESKRPLRDALTFLWSTYPRVFARSRDAIVTSNLLLWGGTLAGLAIATAKPEFVDLFLSQEAQDDLARGRLWTDDLSMEGASLASAIGTNNVRVAIMAWAGGLAGGLGTAFTLILNGMMLGSVWAATAHAGLAGRLFEWIAAHGPLELFLVTVAGAAGLELGRGLLEHRGVPRDRALAAAGRTSVELMLGTVPWFALAAAVEGYLSPTDTDLDAKLAVGGALLALFGLYVVRPGARA